MAFMQLLALAEIPGIGPKTTARLAERGLRTVNDVLALDEAALRRKVPVIGLCLGMHLLTEGSEEGALRGLGWIRGRTVRFHFGPAAADLKIPHMGWNEISPRGDAPIVRDLLPASRFYFVHSYHVVLDDPADVAATTRYGYDFPSIVQSGNIMGTQFHPEKSHKFGMRLLERFVTLS